MIYYSQWACFMFASYSVTGNDTDGEQLMVKSEECVLYISTNRIPLTAEGNSYLFYWSILQTHQHTFSAKYYDV